MVGNFNNNRLNFKGLFLGLFVFIAVFGMVFACKAPVTPTVPEPERYTVTFHFDGKTLSETYTAGEELELLTKEEAGISDDYELGWYTDSDCTIKAHGGTPVNTNLDIYGKLTEIDPSKEYTVKFVNDGGTALGEEQTVNAGGFVTVPGTPTPEKSEHEGWIFSGWSLSLEGTDLLSVSGGKISIEASWADDDNVITIYAVYIDPDSERPVTGIELSPGEDFELYVGDTKNLTVLYTPKDANVGRDLSWICEPAGIVKVDSTADGGKVTALSEGSATITVKLSGNETITDSVNVKVSRKTVTVTGVELKASGSSVSVGGSLNLTLTATECAFDRENTIFKMVNPDDQSQFYTDEDGKQYITAGQFASQYASAYNLANPDDMQTPDDFLSFVYTDPTLDNNMTGTFYDVYFYTEGGKKKMSVSDGSYAPGGNAELIRLGGEYTYDEETGTIYLYDTSNAFPENWRNVEMKIEKSGRYYIFQVTKTKWPDYWEDYFSKINEELGIDLLTQDRFGFVLGNYSGTEYYVPFGTLIYTLKVRDSE